MTKSLNEDQLVSLLKQKNEDAFRILIRNYQGKLYRTAYAITLNKEESEDIVQEVFIKVFENIDEFKKGSLLSTWLHRITINHCLNWRRKWKRRFRKYHQPLDDVSDSGEEESKTEVFDDNTPEKLYQKKEIEKIITDALKKLPEESRVVFVLKEIDGMSYDDIAEILNINRGTVSSRLHYARQRLINLLEPKLKKDL